MCCDVAVTQIIYLSLNKQDSTEQARNRFHEEGLVWFLY
jgi:phage gp36-like protein